MTPAILRNNYTENDRLQFIHSTAMCRIRRFLAVRRSFFHDSLFYNFPATLLHQLFFHPLSPHLPIYFLVYLSILLFPKLYTGCPRRNVPDFGRVFLMLKYSDITQNTYVKCGTVTEMMAREKCGLLAGLRTVPVGLQCYPCRP